MRNLKTYLVIIVVGLTLAACGGKKGVKDDDMVSAESDSASASGLSDGSGSLGTSLEAELAANNKIYFEYDSSAVDQNSRSVIEAHAQYLIDNPGVTVVLEGHADERGTREYNLALGERRALSVSEIMVAYGVERSRLQPISYGEERPEALDSGEAAWALNRRVVILR